MSIHIEANPGDIAESILLPGDPLRAQYIAENFLTDAVCYNKVRGMYGYTGLYKGKRVSVQGTGMGMPSASIYIHELINEYHVKRLIRVGTCGSISPSLHNRDTILAMGSSTNSGMSALRFGPITYSATADFELLHKAYTQAAELGINVVVGNVFADDLFYNDRLMEQVKLLSGYGVLAIDMESYELFVVAAKLGVKALTILTVSDEILTGAKTTALERQTSFQDMIRLALETI
ncbi:purine nucleoside phosphorylase deod-type [Lucifera butyrica]|uniref:Purine nucleoside phosphorylase DeoD-type n=1 Tax=Lucifera butyrica TaxID=1351585 RepID=A0A498R6V7_9FIRM|nr:purine-nucleoside phosphorylase [Lucifera butyrica]VBB07091.1 purine nucleoside phosphorylase deod-type [Lucifera butyrica]